MNRRNAVTLTEVLIAIFVLSIGLLALLSLFPLGAAQMAQALKDQRCAEAASVAGAAARMIWKEACNTPPNPGGASDPTFLDPTPLPASVLRFPYATGRCYKAALHLQPCAASSNQQNCGPHKGWRVL